MIRQFTIWTLAAFCAGPGLAETHDPESHARVAAISGVHTPHQGFALSATVPSDKLCLELAQNLSSELGIVVHVVCTNSSNGETTIVAECGYARSPEADSVQSYSHGWGSDDRYLMCVPADSSRFQAIRLSPNVEALRPKAR